MYLASSIFQSLPSVPLCTSRVEETHMSMLHHVRSVPFRTRSVGMAMGSALALTDWLDAVLVVFLSNLATAAEALCLAKVRSSLRGLHGMRPRTAVLAEPGRVGVAVQTTTFPTERE